MSDFLKKASNFFLLFGLLFGLSLVLACTSAQMELSGDLASNVREMTVKGRNQFTFNQNFTFGPYKVQEVKRSLTETTAWGFLGYENIEAKQEYGFVLICPALPDWKVNCASGVKQQVFEAMLPKGSELTWELSGLDTLVGSLNPQDSKSLWRLVVSKSTNQETSRGILVCDKTTIWVEGTNRLANSSIPLSDTAGFHFKQEGKIIAAVEVINQGRVWFGPGLTFETQNAIAAASSALLLYQDIGRD